MIKKMFNASKEAENIENLSVGLTRINKSKYLNNTYLNKQENSLTNNNIYQYDDESWTGAWRGTKAFFKNIPNLTSENNLFFGRNNSVSRAKFVGDNVVNHKAAMNNGGLKPRFKELAGKGKNRTASEELEYRTFLSHNDKNGNIDWNGEINDPEKFANKMADLSGEFQRYEGDADRAATVRNNLNKNINYAQNRNPVRTSIGDVTSEMYHDLQEKTPGLKNVSFIAFKNMNNNDKNRYLNGYKIEGNSIVKKADYNSGYYNNGLYTNNYYNTNGYGNIYGPTFYNHETGEHIIHGQPRQLGETWTTGNVKYWLDNNGNVKFWDHRVKQGEDGHPGAWRIDPTIPRNNNNQYPAPAPNNNPRPNGGQTNTNTATNTQRGTQTNTNTNTQQQQQPRRQPRGNQFRGANYQAGNGPVFKENKKNSFRFANHIKGMTNEEWWAFVRLNPNFQNKNRHEIGRMKDIDINNIGGGNIRWR
jgi:hypothetical protein